MASHDAVLPDFCPNCAHPVSGPYCSACGQKVRIETPTLFEFLHEYLHHYVTIDGTLTLTLRMLLSQPGKLTTEYLIGRRHRYIKPLQLYLTISFIFFVALGLVGTTTSTTLEQVKSADAHQNVVEVSADSPARLRAWAAHANTRLTQFSRDPTTATNQLSRELRSVAPYGVFILMPIFAALLGLVFYRRRVRYGAHLVFTLHLHALVFLLFLLSFLPWDVAGWLSLISVVYLLLALKQVYGGRWLPTLARSALLLILYWMFVLLVALGLLAYTFGT